MIVALVLAPAASPPTDEAPRGEWPNPPVEPPPVGEPTTTPADPPQPTTHAPPSKRARAQAARAVKRGKAAAGSGDYPAAIAAFEEASRLDPSPAISFNLAVCHHGAMLAAAAEDPARTTHRDAAIASYRAYLDTAPEASDRADVERIIAELTPPVVPATPDEPPVVLGPPPELRDAVTRIDPDDPVDEPTTPTTRPPSPPDATTRAPAYIGPFIPIVLAHLGRLGDTDFVERMPLVGLGIRGGAYLGRRDRLELGGEVGAYGQPSDGSPRHRLLDGHLAATLGYGAPIGEKRRLLLGGGGVLGLLFETMHHGGTSTLTCPTSTDGKVSDRTGLLVGGRFVIGVLLGRRRNHELALRITPSLALMGNGKSGSPRDGETSCGDSPFGEAGLPGGPALVTMIDLGYSPRF